MPRSVTDHMISDIARGYIRARVEIVEAGTGATVLSTSPSSSAPRMLVVGGRLINDESRNYPGSGTLDVLLDDATADDVIPITGGDPFAPVAPMFVQVSFYAKDDPMMVHAYGRYEVSRVELTESSDGAMMQVEMFDNSRKVDMARFWRAEQFGGGDYQLLLLQLLTPVLPLETLFFEEYPNPLGFHSWDAQDSRLTAMNEIVTSIGFQVDWNYNGRGDIHVLSNPGTAVEPHWRFVEGVDLKIVGGSRELSDEKAYNGVIASGETVSNGTPPVMAEAWDINPTSPTYFDPLLPAASKYGPKPFFYVSQFIATPQQAQDAANARLPSVLGMTEVITFETLPHPGIIPGDVVEIQRSKTGIFGLYIVNAVDLPITTNSMMTVTCRERRLTTVTT